MNSPNVDSVLTVMTSKGYPFFDTGLINLVGIRTDDMEANKFNDFITCFYKFDGMWSFFPFPGTTDPGTFWRLNPDPNVSGTAILKPGYYPNSHFVGLHKGYEALQQKQPVTVYRDANRDAKLDVTGMKEDTGIFGINLHRANEAAPSVQVDKWSAGCQVLQDPDHFTFMMRLCKRSIGRFGNSFSYGLLEEKDFATPVA